MSGNQTKREVSLREGFLSLPPNPALLVSMEYNGEKNVMTAGMFSVFSGKPPLIGIGIALTRHSYGIIYKSREFVVNVPTKKLIKALCLCGYKSGRDVDKFSVTGLSPLRASKVKAPLIQECPANVECKVVREVETGNYVWFIGEVMAMHVDEEYDWEESLFYKWTEKGGFFYRVGKQVGEIREQ